jgi:hypothetical protein
MAEVDLCRLGTSMDENDTLFHYFHFDIQLLLWEWMQPVACVKSASPFRTVKTGRRPWRSSGTCFEEREVYGVRREVP